MSRLVLLDTGTELNPTTVAALRSAPRPIRLRLCEPSPPFRDGQVVHVALLEDTARRPSDLLLGQVGERFRLFSRCHAPAAGAPLGRVIALQRGTTTISVEGGLAAHLPCRWLPSAVDALEVLARFRHPLTPRLFQGSAEVLLARVREKYDRASEVCQYSRGVDAGASDFELELIARNVKQGGRLLDIGCGAGREAIAFARAGYRVVAIDIASGMIEAACENAVREGLAIEFRVQSVTDFTDPADSYDGAFFAGSLHHIPGRALRIDTLRRVACALAPEGALILSVMYRGPLGFLSRTRLVDLLRELGARIFGPRRFSEPGDGWVRDVSEASDSCVPIFFHDFSGAGAIRREIEAAGLRAHEVRSGWWVCRKASG